MKYFLDTEFKEGFHKPLFGRSPHYIDFISIGIVCIDGRTYYAISNEFDLKLVWKDDWLRENVLKPIHQELCEKEGVYAKTYHWELFTPFTLKSMKNLIKWNGKPNIQIANEIVEFIYGPTDNLDGMSALEEAQKYEMNDKSKYPEFYGYYADYDWVLFCSLFGRMIDLPKGFPMYCRDLKQMLDEKLYRYDNSDSIKSSIGAKYTLELYNMPKEDRLKWVKEVVPQYPKQQIEHNALADAKWNLELYKFLQIL